MVRHFARSVVCGVRRLNSGEGCHFSTRLFKSVLVVGALFLSSGPAWAQLMVHPTRIVFDGRESAAQLEVINNSGQETSYRIELVNRRMDEQGQMGALEAAGPGERFADDMLRYSPRRVVLAPGASQVVRVMVNKPVELPAGEYRSHLLFAQQPVAGQNLDEPGDDRPDKGIGVALNALVGVSIPVIVRHGDTSAQVALDHVEYSAGTPAGHVSMEIHRNGTRSVYGDIVVEFTPQGGQAVAVARAGGVAVYTPNVLRRARLPLHPPEGTALKDGTLTVTYRERPQDGGKVLAQASVPLP